MANTEDVYLVNEKCNQQYEVETPTFLWWNTVVAAPRYIRLLTTCLFSKVSMLTYESVHLKFVQTASLDMKLGTS